MKQCKYTAGLSVGFEVGVESAEIHVEGDRRSWYFSFSLQVWPESLTTKVGGESAGVQ